MGSPISGFQAKAIKQASGNIALPRIQPKPCLRYVDDSFLVIKRSNMGKTYKTTGNIFKDINFTMKSEEDRAGTSGRVG